jgi:TatA/E family protein of Tat protein translocase
MPGKVDDFGSPYHNSSTDSENLIFCVGWSQDRNAIVTRAFLGVGAPEAVLVGVVALVLFGPKGLAQAAKSLGQGVKAIAPTLKELTDISSDLKSTIEDEIGLNEIRNELESTLSPATKPRPTRNATVLTDDEDPDIVSKREESAKIAWSVGETSPSIGQEDDRNIDSMSVEELEAEILRRKSSGPLES